MEALPHEFRGVEDSTIKGLHTMEAKKLSSEKASLQGVIKRAVNKQRNK